MTDPAPPARAEIPPRVVGRSVRGRAIVAHFLGDAGPPLLVHAGIHGDEPGAVALVERFVATLESAPPSGRVIALPAVNPDGLAELRKDNARGVDLNRNFPARSWRRDHPPGYDPGPSPLSEPESAALAALVDAEAPARIVAVHQPFACVNWDGPARELAERMAAASGWPAVADVGYPTPGSFGACYGVDRGLPVITLELPRPVGEEDLLAGLRALRAALGFPG